MPPRPNTATVAPGCTLAVLSTAPMPVVMPQPSRQTLSSGASGADLRQRDLRHDRVLGERRRAHVVHAASCPCARGGWCRRASGPCPAWRGCAPHRLVLPLRQNLQLRHSGMYSGMTWSPGLSVVTPGPTSSTMPPPSWPSTHGEQSRRIAPAHRVRVGVADAGGDQAHETLARLRPRELDLVDHQRLSAARNRLRRGSSCRCGLHRGAPMPACVWRASRHGAPMNHPFRRVSGKSCLAALCRVG